MRSDEFKAKVFYQSTCFYVMGFNDGLLKAREFQAVPISTLYAAEYDSDNEVQYGPDDRAIPKIRPPAP